MEERPYLKSFIINRSGCSLTVCLCLQLFEYKYNLGVLENKENYCHMSHLFGTNIDSYAGTA